MVDELAAEDAALDAPAGACSGSPRPGPATSGLPPAAPAPSAPRPRGAGSAAAGPSRALGRSPSCSCARLTTAGAGPSVGYRPWSPCPDPDPNPTPGSALRPSARACSNASPHTSSGTAAGADVAFSGPAAAEAPVGVAGTGTDVVRGGLAPPSYGPAAAPTPPAHVQGPSHLKRSRLEEWG